MIQRCQPLLGTFVHIRLAGASENALHKEAGKAFQLIRSIQRLMGFHDPDSDLSRLNRCAHIAPLRVHPWTWHVIDKALKMSRKTGGAFDVTTAPALVRWGYLPAGRAPGEIATTGRWQSIELLPDFQVRFHEPLLIDLGGIAKGFAVDKAIDLLSARSPEQAAVNAGGDLRIYGATLESVTIRDPATPLTRWHHSDMLRPAVATSATYFSRKRLGGSTVSPIVDPSTNRPLRRRVSVSVFAPTCLEADALTKAVLFSSETVRRRVLRDHDSVALMLAPGGEPFLLPS